MVVGTCGGCGKGLGIERLGMRVGLNGGDEMWGYLVRGGRVDGGEG